MSLGGGGGTQLVTRLREQTASAGAAGADPTTGTLQRNNPCQCHRPSRGKASILPSKWPLFLLASPTPFLYPREPFVGHLSTPDGATCPAPPPPALCARQREAGGSAPDPAALSPLEPPWGYRYRAPAAPAPWGAGGGVWVVASSPSYGKDKPGAGKR